VSRIGDDLITYIDVHVARRVLGKGNYRPIPAFYISLIRCREASYYNIKVGDTDVTDVAWYVLLLPTDRPLTKANRQPARYYPAPKDAAAHIKDHVAFYKNKVVIKE